MNGGSVWYRAIFLVLIWLAIFVKGDFWRFSFSWRAFCIVLKFCSRIFGSCLRAGWYASLICARFIEEIRHSVDYTRCARIRGAQATKISAEKILFLLPFCFDSCSDHYSFLARVLFLPIPIDFMKLYYRLPYVRFITKKRGQREKHCYLSVQL